MHRNEAANPGVGSLKLEGHEAGDHGRQLIKYPKRCETRHDVERKRARLPAIGDARLYSILNE